MYRLPFGLFNTFEGGIAMDIEYVWRWRDKVKLFFLEPDSVERIQGPPYRQIKVFRDTGEFWNFSKNQFTEYTRPECVLQIHRSEQTKWENFFNSYVRNHEEKNNNH